MYQNRFIFIATMLLFLTASCIQRFDPEIKSTDAVKYVITGQVNSGDDVQRINIGTSSPISKPEIIPVTGCSVKIIDAKGNEYPATDVWSGNYDVTIPKSELVPGNAFKVDILIPGGTHIISDFDQIQSGPPVDSVYYEVQSLPTSSPVEFTDGIQFYVDLNAGNYTCRNYRYDVVETYEYHTKYPIEWWYNGRLRHTSPPDSSKMVCWRTSTLRDVYMISTKELAENTYKKYPLNFVDNQSSARLVYGYSLLVRQYTMSDEAFKYWEKIRVNSQEQGGLYESQPMSIKGNLHNVTNPDQDVLGFFSATTVSQKRIFVKDVPDLPIEFVFNCVIGELPWGGLQGTDPVKYPIYLPQRSIWIDDQWVSTYDLLSIDHECVDCTATVGGTIVKPDFWPN